MAGFGIDGLSSGLNTSALIASLMQIESMPRTQLAGSVSTVRSQVSAWQTINSTLRTLGERAVSLAGVASEPATTGRSTLEGLTVRTQAGSAIGAIDVRIDSAAAAHAGVTATLPTTGAAPATFVLVDADGTEHEVTAASGSASDIATALRAARPGLIVTVIGAGTDSQTGEPLSRLQIAASETGEEHRFSIFRGTQSDLAAGQATDLFAEPGAALLSIGRDAQLTLWAGTAAEQVRTAAGSTFVELLPGVSLTVAPGTIGQATVTVERDDAAPTTAAADLISGLKGVLDYLTSSTLVTPTNSASGAAATRAGVLAGDFTAREVRARVVDAVGRPVDGRSPSTVGISFTSSGEVQFDAERLAEALRRDPAEAMSTLSAIAGRVSSAVDSLSDRFEGIVTKRIDGDQRRIADITAQIDSWDRRLELRRAALERTYAALEVQLGRLSSQSSWLGSQLSALTRNGAV